MAAVLEIPEPNEKQKIFFECVKKIIAYGGARGGGKSWAVRIKAVLLAFYYSGIKIMIIRKTMPELRANHIKPLISMLNCYAKKKKDRLATYNTAERCLTFPNGSTISFQYCKNDQDAERIQGIEADVVFIDEATQQTEEQFKKITASVRGVGKFPRRIYLTMNPGGVGHGWVKRLFIDRVYEADEDPEDYEFVQALVTDNKVLMENDPDYVKFLDNLPPKLKKAWRFGDWNIFEGQFFEEFRDDPEHYEDRQYTHVINPFDPKSDWPIYRSFDWGYAKPFSCGWWTVDYDGVLYRILEFYGCGNTANEGIKWFPDKVFSEIHRIETEHKWLRGKKIIGVADPAIFDAQTGESIADTAAKHQVFFSKGDHKRIPGWMQMHYRLAFDENGYPMMYVFSNCKAFIRTIPLLIYDEHNVEDLDTKLEDHVADETRYLCMERPITPLEPKEADPYYEGDLYKALNIPKENLSKRKAIPRMEIIDAD